MSELLGDWKTVRLGDFCTVQNGFPFKSERFHANEGIPLIRVRSLKTQSGDIRITGDYDPAFLVHNNDVLIGMDGDFQPCWWQGNLALLNQRVCRITRFSPNVDPFYIYQAIKSPLKQIEDATHFTTVKHLSALKVADICIALPPLPEQRAIAATLRAVQDARDARRRELAAERERKAALMEELFTYGLRGELRKDTEIGMLPQNWRVVLLGDIAEVAYGLTVNQQRRLSEQSAPYLTVANVTRGRLRLEDVKNIGLLEGDAKRFQLKRGDVLLVEGNGNPQLLGSAAVWNDEIPFMMHQNHLIRARVNRALALPFWAMSYINSTAGRAQLLGKAKTSSGLHSINSRLVSNLLMPCPPLEEQQDITEVLTACDGKIAALEAEATLHDELFRTLLDDLMTGRVSARPLIEEEEKPKDATRPN